MEHKAELKIKNKKDVVLQFDRDGKILQASSGVEQMTGYKPGELVGRFLVEFLSDPHEEGKVLSAITESIAQASMVSEEFRFRHKEEKDFFAEIILVSSGAVTGDGKGCRGLLRDVTHYHQAAKRLEEAHALRAQFTSTVSHELRTPLTVIKETLVLLLSDGVKPMDDGHRHFLDMAMKSVSRLEKLIAETLDLQALEQGRKNLHFRETSVGEIFNELLRLKKDASGKKGLKLFAETDPGVPRIHLDREKILECFGVLLDFAIAKSENGNIHLKAALDGTMVRISIHLPSRENPCDNLSRMFLRFEPLNEDEKVKLGRTGVEFARVREIFEKHSGKIWAYYFAGQGTFFQMLLPAMEKRSGRISQG